jgi:hypothetical protein
MPKLDGILETAIHTLDMWRSRALYESVPRLTPFFRIHARSAHTAATHESDMLIRVDEPFAVPSCLLLHTK